MSEDYIAKAHAWVNSIDRGSFNDEWVLGALEQHFLQLANPKIEHKPFGGRAAAVVRYLGLIKELRNREVKDFDALFIQLVRKKLRLKKHRFELLAVHVEQQLKTGEITHEQMLLRKDLRL